MVQVNAGSGSHKKMKNNVYQCIVVIYIPHITKIERPKHLNENRSKAENRRDLEKPALAYLEDDPAQGNVKIMDSLVWMDSMCCWEAWMALGMGLGGGGKGVRAQRPPVCLVRGMRGYRRK